MEKRDAIYEGKITALYLVGENPLLTEANAKHVREALEKLDFFVVSELFMTPTARFADIILPVTSAVERDDINSPWPSGPYFTAVNQAGMGVPPAISTFS